MGLADFEVFVRERLRAWDENVDLSPGSPIDAQVIQPLLRRIGTDPFTVDASTFIVTRLTQEFPDLAFTDGDAVSDLLVKPALLLWDPIIREIQRVKNSLSFRDPATLTTDEAEALGANLFVTRDTGNKSRGVSRIYFTQPQPINITPLNFFTTKGGLHFFPTIEQSIKSDEMALNLEGDLYYFDVNVIAETTGDEYNIEPGDIATIANVAAAVRVTNKVRFRFGLPEEDSTTYIARAEQGLTERSMVTAPGIAARLPKAFPEITRLNVVGFNDPEMERDVISGGSLGDIKASGVDAQASADGRNYALTRNVAMASGNFTTVIGSPGPVKGWVVTLFGMFSTLPSVRDIEVTEVISDTILELAETVIKPGSTGAAWCLRKKEITLSGIPGGILFPTNATGEVIIESDKIHIGGCTDILVRGAGVDTSTLVIDTAYDDQPAYTGDQAGVVAILSVGYVGLLDWIYGTDYVLGDQVYEDFSKAAQRNWKIEILDGPAAGIYSITGFDPQTPGSPALFTIYPTPVSPPGSYRWRISSNIHMDLVEPKQTRITGYTGSTIQNVSTFTTVDAIDLVALGVSEGDILRIHEGLDEGDFEIGPITIPHTIVAVDRPFKSTRANLSYTIFRRNTAGGVVRPLLRINSIDILDTSGQPVGAQVPYAKAVDVVSRSFQNAGNGVKIEVKDAQLGLLSRDDSLGYAFGAGGNLQLSWDGGFSVTTALAGGMTATTVVAAINVESQLAYGFDLAFVYSYGGLDYVGIIPVGKHVTTSGSTASVMTALFGDTHNRTSRDIRSDDMETEWGSWTNVVPAIDANLDVAQVVDGVQAGNYGDQAPGNPDARALLGNHDFAPEVQRIVRVGARSIGSARVYFIDPTSVTVTPETLFTTTDDNGILLKYFPDPTMRRQIYPGLPNGSKPLNGECDGASVFVGPGVDFTAKGVRVGDLLVLDFVPLQGTANLADPVPGLAMQQLKISLDNGPDKLITFVQDVGTLNAVSRAGVADQINATAGTTICSIVEDPPASGDYYLKFNPTTYLIVRQQNSNPSSANAALGFSNVLDSKNNSANVDSYTITSVAYLGDVTKLYVDGVFANPALVEQQYSIFRTGEQRISSTEMQKQTSAGGLYYFDVELVSDGPGDLWNISADRTMEISDYVSDGYYLDTTKPELTFSTTEELEIVMSRSVLEPGVDDDPENATQLTGQRLSVAYEFSSLVQGTQSFIGSESERVINDSPLGRHLIPHYVRLDLTYAGGSIPSEVARPVQDHIRTLPPDVPLEASEIQRIVSNKGATYIQNPLELIAVVYNFDRTVTAHRSKDTLTTGRLAAFIPDRIVLTRKTT